MFFARGDRRQPARRSVVSGRGRESLTADDAPTFERALRAMEEGDLAWLGFKIVYDADEAQRNTDNEVTKKTAT